MQDEKDKYSAGYLLGSSLSNDNMNTSDNLVMGTAATGAILLML